MVSMTSQIERYMAMIVIAISPQNLVRKSGLKHSSLGVARPRNPHSEILSSSKLASVIF